MGVTISEQYAPAQSEPDRTEQTAAPCGAAEELQKLTDAPMSFSALTADLKNADLSANNKRYTIR